MKRFVCHINNLLINSMRVSKLLIVTGILILVMLLVTCDSDELSKKADDMEYTDVEYSEDGTGVTIYLDGKGVPKTRSQRAVTTDLARAAFDFVEVIFIGSSTTARTSWVLGEPANIFNVERPYNYASILSACMFVGKDDGKVLLGVGKLTNTRGTTTTPNTATTIDKNTTSVTFTLAAIQSGLCANNESANQLVNGFEIAVDSFNYDFNDGTAKTRAGNSFRKPLPPSSSVGYPVYYIPTSVITTARYIFGFSGDAENASDCISAIKHINTAAVYPVVQKKVPRYATNGRYEEPRNRIDTSTQVAFRTTYPPANNASFVSTVPLIFTPAESGGFFAFNIQIPVYMVSLADDSNGVKYKTWYIRTGVGSEFYSLDDGVSRGGCVFMSVGISEAEFDNIEWTWFKGF